AGSTSLNVVSVVVTLAGLTSTATRSADGTNSRRSNSRFAVNSALKKLVPVRLPPGRARLATSPSLTGSAAVRKAIGIVGVAGLAASGEEALVATITATGRRTNSAASSGSRSI